MLVTIIAEVYRQQRVNHPGNWIESRRFSSEAKKSRGGFFANIDNRRYCFSDDGLPRSATMSSIRYRIAI